MRVLMAMMVAVALWSPSLVTAVDFPDEFAEERRAAEAVLEQKIVGTWLDYGTAHVSYDQSSLHQEYVPLSPATRTPDESFVYAKGDRRHRRVFNPDHTGWIYGGHEDVPIVWSLHGIESNIDAPGFERGILENVFTLVVARAWPTFWYSASFFGPNMLVLQYIGSDNGTMSVATTILVRMID